MYARCIKVQKWIVDCSITMYFEYFEVESLNRKQVDNNWELRSFHFLLIINVWISSTEATGLESRLHVLIQCPCNYFLFLFVKLSCQVALSKVFIDKCTLRDNFRMQHCSSIDGYKQIPQLITWYQNTNLRRISLCEKGIR